MHANEEHLQQAETYREMARSSMLPNLVSEFSSMAVSYERLAELDQKRYEIWRQKHDLYDAIEHETSSLFINSASIRSTIKEGVTSIREAFRMGVFTSDANAPWRKKCVKTAIKRDMKVKQQNSDLTEGIKALEEYLIQTGKYTEAQRLEIMGCIQEKMPERLKALPNVIANAGHATAVKDISGMLGKYLDEETKKEMAIMLCANKYREDKVIAMVEAYYIAEPKYGREFAIGLMANIAHEGKAGHIEGIGSSSYWDNVSEDVRQINGQVIISEKMVDDLLNGIPDGTVGIGVGSIQWSGSRRIALLNKYKESAVTYKKEELLKIEVTYMMDELANRYKDVPTLCEGKDAEDCAAIICLNYEIPENATQEAKDRSITAQELSSLMRNVM